MDRKLEQAELIEQIGYVLRPLRELCADSGSYDDDARRRIRAQFITEWEALSGALRGFCNHGGIDYTSEWGDISSAMGRLTAVVRQHLRENPHLVAADLANIRQQLLVAIAAVPFDSGSTIFEARTPFTTYMKLRALFSTVASSVVFVDRYVSGELFHRYFGYTDAKVSITVVTSPAKFQNAVRYPAFLDISRLFAQERPTTYRLLEHSDVHDRWLRFDGNLYHAGGSAKDAGASDYTLSRIDSPANHQKVTDFIASGNELFGPSQPKHP